MATKPITPVKMQTQEWETNQLQQNIFNAIASISGQLINTPANGQFLTGQELTMGDNVLKHKLGVIPIGYIIISQNGVASFYLADSTSNTITLHTSADVTASIFIF
jgi:hypothetical protein